MQAKEIQTLKSNPSYLHSIFLPITVFALPFGIERGTFFCLDVIKSWEEWGCSSVGGSPGSTGESNRVGVPAHLCSPCSWETQEAGGPEAQSQPWLHMELGFGVFRKLSQVMALEVSKL